MTSLTLRVLAAFEVNGWRSLASMRWLRWRSGYPRGVLRRRGEQLERDLDRRAPAAAGLAAGPREEGKRISLAHQDLCELGQQVRGVDLALCCGIQSVYRWAHWSCPVSVDVMVSTKPGQPHTDAGKPIPMQLLTKGDN